MLYCLPQPREHLYSLRFIRCSGSCSSLYILQVTGSPNPVHRGVRYHFQEEIVKKAFALIVLLTMAFALVTTATAKDLPFPDPEKTVTIVVPHAAGGGTDLAFRPLVEEMKRIARSSFIVSNVPGAGSATGANEVINSAADGYTLLASGTHTIAAELQGLTAGNEQLEGIIGMNWDPFIVAANVKKPWNTMKELVAAAKATPGKISLGNAGMGGATGVASVGINLAFGKSFNVTPFNGGADLIASVLGGHCDVGIFSQSEFLANKANMKALVILSDDKSSLAELAYIPTLAAAGYPDLSVPGGSFKSLSVKKGTPPAIKAYLADLAEKAFKSDSYQKFMAKNGLIPAFTKLADLDAYNARIVADYLPIMREAGLLKKK